MRRIWPWALGLGPVAAVISLAVMSREWFFNTAGWIDPWIYRALIQDWGNPETWEGNYKASRLGWVVPAWLVSPLTNGYWGQIVFGAVLLVGGGWLVGAAINRLIGPGAGVVAGVLTSAWSALVFLGGPSYHNTIVPLWFGMAMLSLAAAGNAPTARRRRGLLVLAGIGLGMLIHANPTTVNLIPLLVIAGVAAAPMAWRARARTYARSLMWAAAGVATATIALSLAALAVGRSPWFFIDGIRLAAQTAGNQDAWYVELDGSWLSNGAVSYSWHLVLPAVGFASALGVIVALLARRSWRARPQRMLLAIGVVATSLIYLIWHLIGQTSLNPDYFAFGLVLTSAIGVALATRWDEVDRHAASRTYWLIAPAWGLIFALCMALVPIMPDTLLMPFELSWFLAAGLGIGGVVLLVASGRRGTALLLVAAGALGMANLVSVARWPERAWWWSQSSVATACKNAGAALDQDIWRLNAQVDRAFPNWRSVKPPVVWWSPQTAVLPNPCSPDGPGSSKIRRVLGGALISLRNTGYQPFFGRMSPSAPPRLTEIARDELLNLRNSRWPVVVLSPRRTEGSSRMNLSHGFLLDCLIQDKFQALEVCGGTIRLIGTNRAGRRG